MEEFGPVQILVVGFDGTAFTGEILPELRRLKEHEVIRLVDLVVVAKDADGEVVGVEISDLSDEERMEFGAIAGALVGLGMEGLDGVEDGAIAGAAAAAEGDFLGDEVVWSVADSIPPDSTAAVALIEHRWAIPLRDGIDRAGGRVLGDAWLHPEDLLALGDALASEAP